MLEKMAAPSDEPRQKSLLEHVDGESGALWEDERGLQQHVVDFLTNKAGDDLKSHKNIGDILESLKEENDVLSEQVNLPKWKKPHHGVVDIVVVSSSRRRT